MRIFAQLIRVCYLTTATDLRVVCHFYTAAKGSEVLNTDIFLSWPPFCLPT